MDEAATYRAFIAPIQPNHWAPHSNNHVLNSLLMRLATTVFGLSQLSVRLPALAGTCVYIVSCYFLSRSMIEQTITRVTVLACLILNPYLGDFYVTARGYSLAIGFLTCAIAIVARVQFRGSGNASIATAPAWVGASALLGLSFVANFPFALIDATTWAGLLLWTLASKPRATCGFWRLLAASVLPGALVVFVFASWTLLHWPAGQLWDGAHSLGETFRSIARASLFQPNEEIANPLVLSAANFVRPFLIPALCGAAVWQAGLLLIRRGLFSQCARARRTIEFCMVVAGALGAALLMHWIAFHCFGLLLPRNRMASYIIPFWTLTVGSLAAIPVSKNVLASTGRGVLVGLLSTLALYYAVCLRSAYFFEWWSNADVKEAYYVLAYYNHSYNVIDVPSRFPWTDCLEFYRRTSGRETFTEFTDSSSMPYGKDVYALYESQDRELITRQHLRIVYRGRVDNDLVVAIRPGLELTAPGN